MKLSPIDKLARNICWIGFTTKDAKRGKTAASYWKSLPEETQKHYRDEANHFVWLYDNIDHHLLNPLSFKID